MEVKDYKYSYVRIEFTTTLGTRGAFTVAKEAIKGTRDAFIAEQRRVFSKSYPYLFGYGADRGEAMLGMIWDSQNPPKKATKDSAQSVTSE